MKKIFTSIIAVVLAFTMLFSLSACTASTDNGETVAGSQNDFSSILSEIESLTAKIDELNAEIDKLNGKIDELNVAEPINYAAESYEKVKFIDKVLSDRDCYKGENFKLTQKWIHTTLLQAGYSEDDIEYQEVPLSKYVLKESLTAENYPAVKSFSDDGKTYSKNGRKYVEDENGTFTYATFVSENIIVTKQGASNKQIIIGMHYDGDGTGDNGSGVALGLTTAEKFYDIETAFTLKFVFFTGEEYGLYGSKAYAAAMSEEEIENTIYMINMDSLICGDYCYIYGGVQDDENETVNLTCAYDNAMEVAQSLGLSFKSNPWTYDNPAPGYDSPDYASPSTGNWSDHAPFAKLEIPYLYLEATNWDIPGPYNEYDGYGETYFIGMLMNTENDYLEYIETYFPGRAMNHLTKFSALLNGLLMQSEWNY